MEQNNNQYLSGNVNSFNLSVSGSYNNIVSSSTTVTDERSQILAWLSPLESWRRHRDVVSSRVEGVGEWVLETPEFRAWRQDERSVDSTLFCSGVPGAGKTFVCSLVIDTLCDETGDSSVGVACLYCDHSDQREQTPVNMIGSILKQLVAGQPEIPSEIVEAFRTARGRLGGRALQLPKMLEIFPKILASFQRAFICIDALDEFTVQSRIEFLRSLRQILHKSPNTRLFLTGRPHIRSELDRHLTESMHAITMRPSEDDIRKYLAMKLEADMDPEAMDKDLEAEIVEHIPRHYSEIFLLVSLHIDAVLGKVTIESRREKLYQMAHCLSDAYSATLERVRQQRGDKPRLGIAVLMWVSLAQRPLHVNELCHALAVTPGTSDLNIKSIPSIQTLLGCSLGLVAIDRETMTVRLVHTTLREYLRNHLDLFHGAQAAIAEACLTYLNFNGVRRLPPALSVAPEAFPFLQYTSCYWGAHAREETTSLVKDLALQLLKDCERHVSIGFLLRGEDWPEWLQAPDTSGFTGLHCVAHFGITELLSPQTNVEGSDMNPEDSEGRTPLLLAAMNGHKGAVQWLLEQENVKSDLADSRGRTPLSRAAQGGHGDIVKLLLGRSDVAPDSADCQGRKPISWAVGVGREDVLMLFLERADVNPDCPDCYGRSPLYWAAFGGHEEVVKLLLTRDDVNPDLADSRSRTPLSEAAWGGHEGVVALLLGHPGVNPESFDDHAQTPLSWAAARGHEGIVKRLLNEAGVNPDAIDAEGRTPLSLAAERGYGGVVKVLLEQASVDPESMDITGRTPLSWATQRAHEGVAKILLDRSAAKLNSPDDSGHTPLTWAATFGNESMLKLLLGQATTVNLNLDSVEIDGQTLFHLCAQNGHGGAVKLLLELTSLNPDSIDVYGRTPLSWAAGNGHLKVTEVLLNWADVDPDSSDDNGRTPLSWAAGAGYCNVVAFLFNRGGVYGDTLGIDGRTPLSRAAEGGHWGTLGLLLNREDVKPGRMDNDGRTALSWAARSGHVEAVKMLLEWTDICPSVADFHGRTALSWAAGGGYREVVELLLARADVNAESVDNEGRSPMSWALENGNEGIVAILREWTGRHGGDVGIEVSQN